VFILLRSGIGPDSPSSSTSTIQKLSALSADSIELNSATASAFTLFGVGVGRITIGRIIPSSFVPAGENVKRIRRRWKMVIKGDVWVGNSAPPSLGRGRDTAKWYVNPVLLGLGSGGGGNALVTDLTG
jgi:hypothetical protein